MTSSLSSISHFNYTSKGAKASLLPVDQAKAALSRISGAQSSAVSRTASGMPSPAPNQNAGEDSLGVVGHLRSGGIWLVACLLAFALLTLLMAREQSYEIALKVAMAGSNFTEIAARVALVEPSMEGSDINGTRNVNLEEEMLDVKRKYIDLERQLSASEAEKLKQAEYMEVMEKEKDEYLKNMTALQRNSHDLAASAKAIQMMSKYKQKVEEKRLQRDAYLHKLQEMGITTSSGKLIKEQRERGVGVGAQTGPPSKVPSKSKTLPKKILVTDRKTLRGKKMPKLTPRVGGKIVNSRKNSRDIQAA
mmetsp:Transcript_24646/g.41179  ORF Transcript_24646/g.41179 Transcript_24646/m.41179 type:complete len:306 (-) Transcript_24646:158-1075(-)|eukprot:CAMPEP_0198198440 /NCGR_PEP_ID=MMETSP1445-20131203/1915_1 /TAXON_ID=36898 /ORGANISM="Pyramimonas sp., Strain CCMP2087" /LENGTH=305 /DNA_ID=CAMNT_0043868005 /DNA_START=336 /DNA_END=1253 /DNA_ORIENTATION=+